MDEREVYLDNSATTPLFPEVAEQMAFIQSNAYGNPSSLHRKGIEAEKIIDESRLMLSRALGVPSGEIVFTSGGTEANNMAVKGAAYRYRRRGDHLIASTVEHPSVLNAFLQLEKEGFRVSRLKVNREGYVSLEDLEELITPGTILVSIMHINNEVGTIQPIEKIGELIKNKNPHTIFHVDGVQSFGKIKFPAGLKNIDLISLSGHKLHGPKGTGALRIKESIDLQPLFQGGEQEKSYRPGTENVAAIAGFGKAVSMILNDETGVPRMSRLKLDLYRRLKEIKGAELNGPPAENGAPHILNISFTGIKGEILVHALEEQNIYTSSGSACHSRRPEPSHVLTAMGLKKEIIESALRLSLSNLNTQDDVDFAAGKIESCLETIRQYVK